MVDQQSGSYRPRRAFIEPEPETPPPPPSGPAPAAPPPPAPVPPSTPGAASPPRGPVTPPGSGAPAPRKTPVRVPAPGFDDEDAPKPLFRDEYRPWSTARDEAATVRVEPGANGHGGAHGSGSAKGLGSAPAAANGHGSATEDELDEPFGPGSDDTAIRSFTFAPRTRRTGEDTTTILARTGSTARRPDGADVDDFDDDEERQPIGERARWGLAIGIIAAVVVLGLAIGYAVLGLGSERATAPPPSAGSVGSAPASTTASDPAPTAGGPLLDTNLVLSATQAKALDDGRTWKETDTIRGYSQNAPVPACFGGDPGESQPVSQQRILRTVSGSGKDAPTALHDVTAYATVEEAATAYQAVSRTLGTCAAAGNWIESGRGVNGVGDSAAGTVVAVANGKSTEWHTVLIARTGRVLNVLDAGQPGKAVAAAGVADALAAVVKVQCGPAGGKCAGDPAVRNGPPPLGGDEPGFLATGDLPPVAGTATPWEAAPTAPPEEDFQGSSCENVNWATVAAEDRSTRVYLHPESRTAFFGVNEILLTVEDDKAAATLVDRIRKNLEGCRDRLPTATVSKPTAISGPGARGAEVTGFTATVEQKGLDGSNAFRVGVVRAGDKVAYIFANPEGEFDFTDAQWDTIALRAGQRVTQGPA